MPANGNEEKSGFFTGPTRFLLGIQPELGQVLVGLGVLFVGGNLVAECPDIDTQKLGRLAAIMPYFSQRLYDVILLSILEFLE